MMTLAFMQDIEKLYNALFDLLNWELILLCEWLNANMLILIIDAIFYMIFYWTSIKTDMLS